MLKYLLCFTFLSAAILHGDPPLLQRLQQAKSGDFVVLESNKTITLLVIRALSFDSLILEEISAPSLKDRPASWAQWIQERAPGHTSWSMIEIDLKSKQILECYSFTRSTWIAQSPRDHFLATLLHLPLTPMPLDKQRKIGPAPQEGEPDRRQIWTPPFFMNGKKMEHCCFDVYETEWPQDNSELSGKAICLYFDREALSSLPCWIQIDTGQITASLRAIDSGHCLPLSAFRTLPRRIPEFIGGPIKTKNGGLRISIKSPKYYKTFELFAIDITEKEKQMHLISHSIAPTEERIEDEILILDIDAETLRETLLPNHRYTWLLMPTSHTASYSECTKPFTWSVQEVY